MAATITWTTGPYRYETAGKGFIEEVEWRLKGVDGEVSDESIYGRLALARPADADMVERSTFATQANLIAAVKAQLGAEAVAIEEGRCQAAIDALKNPTHATATAES